MKIHCKSNGVMAEHAANCSTRERRILSTEESRTKFSIRLHRQLYKKLQYSLSEDCHLLLKEISIRKFSYQQATDLQGHKFIFHSQFAYNFIHILCTDTISYNFSYHIYLLFTTCRIFVPLYVRCILFTRSRLYPYSIQTGHQSTICRPTSADDVARY